MSSLARIALAAVAFTSLPALAGEGHPHGAPSAAAPRHGAKQERCEHGVAEVALRPLQPEARRRLQGEGRLVRRARAPRVAVRPLPPRAREEGHQVTTARLVAAAALAAAVAACSRAGLRRRHAGEAAAEDRSRGARRGRPVKLCEHRVPADLCTQCNPDLVAVFKEQGDWCEEHGVPESQCLKCNPKLTFTAAAPPAGLVQGARGPRVEVHEVQPAARGEVRGGGGLLPGARVPGVGLPALPPGPRPGAGKAPPVFPEPGHQGPARVRADGARRRHPDPDRARRGASRRCWRSSGSSTSTRTGSRSSPRAARRSSWTSRWTSATT